MTKTILITGSTDGIGKLAAIKLAKEGHHIFLHGRNPQKLQAVVSEIKHISNNESIKGFVADFSDLDAVKQMAEQVNQELSSLDILINNAGIFKSTDSHTKDGFDIRFAVNFFAPYLLTNALLQLLEEGTDARIINLSSAAQASISPEAFRGKQKQSFMESYAQSKLALTMWSFHLAKNLEKVSVIPVNPGSLLNTNMVREALWQHRSSADKGANILYDLAVSDTYSGITDKYFDNDRGNWGMAHQDAYSDAKIDALIQATQKILASL